METILHCLSLLFSLSKYESSFSKWLIPPHIHTARSAGEMYHTAAVWLMPQGQEPVAWAHRIGRDCHTIYQSLPQALCQLRSQVHRIPSYYIFRPSPVFHYKLLLETFLFGAGILWEKTSVHVILSDQRQRKSGFSTIHQIPFGPENLTVVLCQATMPAFSKLSEDNLNRNCILGVLLNNAFPNLLRMKMFDKPQKYNISGVIPSEQEPY